MAALAEELEEGATDIRRIGAIKNGEEVVGNQTRVKVVKNKVAPPFREAEFDVMYGEGISRTGDLLDLAVDKRIIEKSGAWFAYGGERLGQGRENARQFLAEHTDIATELERRVREAVGLTAFGAGGDEVVPVPDVVEEESAAAKLGKKERETTGVPAG